MTSMLRRSALVCLLTLVAARVEAAPFLATFEGVFGAGPVASTAFTAHFFFDAPAASTPYGRPYTEGIWPLSFLSLTVGGQQVLAQPNPGVDFYGLPSTGIEGVFWNVPVQALPAGVVDWSFSGDPQFLYHYSTPSGVMGASGLFSTITITPLAPQSVPEPATLSLLLVGAAFVARRGLRPR